MPTASRRPPRRTAPAPRWPSWTPTTRRPPRRTSPPTGRSSACRPAPPPTAASARWTRTAATSYPRVGSGLGAGDRPRHRDGVRDLPQAARSCWSRPTPPSRPTWARASTPPSAWAPSSCPTAMAAPSSCGEASVDAAYFNHPGVVVTVELRRLGVRASSSRPPRRTSSPWAALARRGRGRPGLDRERMGAGRQRLLAAPRQAGLAARRRLPAPHGGGRVGGRRPRDRGRGLLRRDLGLGRVRRHQRLGADRRRRVRAGRHARAGDLAGELPLPPRRAQRRRRRGEQRPPCSTLSVHGRGGL